MLSILSNKVFRHLFLAQVLALIGTGLATVALGLLAFDIAGADAGQILGTALAIKMLAYIGISPIATAFVNRWPRRSLLVALDLTRATVALFLPFVTEVWQIYVLIFVLQSASAAFTPTFQATIPDIMPEEKDYTKALSLSRLAYDLESVLSPMLAAILLTTISYHTLFFGTTFGFLASAALVVSVMLPKVLPSTVRRSIYDRTTRGLRIYLGTPRLRGLLALNFVAAAASAMVIVNTVVLVQGSFKLSQYNTAWALTAFGLGSMLSALLLPRMLESITDRSAMISGGVLLSICLVVGSQISSYSTLLPLWFALGLGYSLIQTPSGRLLKRSSQSEDRPALFAAQFSLSHSCWLVTYPVAGWLGTYIGLAGTFLVLAAISITALLIASFVWPDFDPTAIPHHHEDQSASAHHLEQVGRNGQHEHDFVIDDLHTRWPK